MRDLLARLEQAEGASDDLDREIAKAAGHQVINRGKLGWVYRENGQGPSWNVPRYTRSLDAAVSLVPEGCGAMFGIGRTRPDEPLYGAIIYADAGRGREIGTGETEASLALALCIAALQARMAAQEGRGDAD